MIRNFIRLNLFLASLLFANPALCQDALVVLQNQKDANKSVINVKWYSQQFVYPEGVNVYRKDAGTQDWVKLNSIPIKKEADIPKVEIEKDSSLVLFREIMKEIKPDQLEGFILLNLMAKTFESSVFSRFIGIQYDDSNVTDGKSYQYKVMLLKNGSESLLATSGVITAGNFVPLEPPMEFYAKQYRKSAIMGWKTEDSRFYAVNIYRSDMANREIKLNNKPVTVSMKKDSAGNLVYPSIKFSDDSVREGGLYSYRIAGIDFFGNETKYTDPVKVVISDLTSPMPPVNIKKTIKNLDVTLNWENKEYKELAGFNVYRSENDSNDYLPVNPGLLPPQVTSFKDMVPKSGGYYYIIASVDTVGNEGYSDKLFAEVADLIPPAVPQNLKAISDTGIVFLSWDTVSDSDLMGYLVYRTVSANSKENYVRLNAIPVKANYLTDTLPANARNYFYYKVASIDTSFNRSEYSEPASIRMPDVMPPAKPFIKNIYILNSNIVIEWLPNNEPDLAGYEVYRSVKDTAVIYSQINEGLLSGEVGRFTDRNATPGITYNYYLVALDSAGNRSDASDYYTTSLTLEKSTDDVSVINSFVVKKRKKAVKMQWDVVAASDFIGFAIYRKLSPGDAPVKLTDIISEKFYNDNYKGKEKPIYQLRLYHKSGNVVKSDWAGSK